MGELETATQSKTATKILLLTALLTLFLGTVGAFSVSFVEPSDSANISGNVTLNVSVPTAADVRNVTFYHNQSQHGVFNNSIAHLTNSSPRQNIFAVTNNTSTFLNDGIVWFNATAVNATDHSDALVRVRVDNAVPDVSPVSPENASNISGRFNISATWSHPTTAVSSAKYTLKNASGQIHTGSLNDTVDSLSPPLKDGPYNITYTVTDKAGSTANAMRTITIDNTPPQGTNDLKLVDANLSMLNFSDKASRILNGKSVGLNWSGYNASNEITDGNGSQVSHLEILVQNRSFNAATKGFDDEGTWYVLNGSIAASATNYTISLASNHQYRFKLRVVDYANNSVNSSNTVNVTLDTTAPELSAVLPDTWTNQSTPAIEADISDIIGMDNTSIRMNISNSTWNASLPITVAPGRNNASVYTVTADSLPQNLTHNSTYTVWVNATDRYQQTAAMNWSFTTDFVKPTNVSVTAVDSPVFSSWFKDMHTVHVSCDDAVSQPAAVAAFLEGSKHEGWTASAPGNVTLRAQGTNTYVFYCRDHAGNVNTETNDTFNIDAGTPVFKASSATVTDGTTKVSTNFTFNLDYNDEIGESGIDAGASSLKLKKLLGQDGSLTNVNWGPKGVSAEVDDLDHDEPYTITGTVVDNVGHMDNITIVFRTKQRVFSGGGGGTSGAASTESSSPSMSLGTVPSQVALAAGWNRTIEIWVNNDGNTNQTDITLRADTPKGVETTFSENNFDLDPQSSRKIAVTFTAAAAAVGTSHSGSLSITSKEGNKASEPVDFTVTTKRPDLQLADAPKELEITRGSSATATFTVKNAGTATAQNVTVFIELPDSSSTIDPNQFTLEPAAETDVSTMITPNLPVGVHEGTMIATAGEHMKTHSFTIKVQPRSEQEKEEIKQRLEQLQQRINELESADATQRNLSNVDTLARKAQIAVQQEDYATAAKLEQEIEKELQRSTMFGPVTVSQIPIALLAIVGLFGIAGYVFKLHRSGVVTAVRSKPSRPGPYRGHDVADTEKPMTWLADAVLDVVDPILDRSSLRERVEHLAEQEYHYQLYEYVTSIADRKIEERRREREKWNVES